MDVLKLGVKHYNNIICALIMPVLTMILQLSPCSSETFEFPGFQLGSWGVHTSILLCLHHVLDVHTGLT